MFNYKCYNNLDYTFNNINFLLNKYNRKQIYISEKYKYIGN